MYETYIFQERFMKNLDLSQTKSHETLAHLHHAMELLEQVSVPMLKNEATEVKMARVSGCAISCIIG
jgi:hypothetical protein